MTNPADSNRAPADGRSDTQPIVPIVGLVVIAVGVIFLAGNLGYAIPLPDRWWAFFILIPAVAALVTAARFYRADEGFSARAAGAATGGALLLTTAAILFFDLDWGTLWPLFVIIVGLGLVARAYRRGR